MSVCILNMGFRLLNRIRSLPSIIPWKNVKIENNHKVWIPMYGLNTFIFENGVRCTCINYEHGFVCAKKY